MEKVYFIWALINVFVLLKMYFKIMWLQVTVTKTNADVMEQTNTIKDRQLNQIEKQVQLLETMCKNNELFCNSINSLHKKLDAHNKFDRLLTAIPKENMPEC